MDKPDINIEKAIEALQNEMYEWFIAIVTNMPNLILAFLVLLFFMLFAKYTKKHTTRIFEKITHNNAVSRLISILFSFTYFLFGFVIALGILQLDGTVKSVLAGAGIIGLALGFAFQDIILNVFSGILIAINEPVKEGDLIETNNTYGYVSAIMLRAVFIENLKGQLVRIPCRDIIQKPLINYTTDGRRRIDVNLRVAFNQNLEFVKNVATEEINKIELLRKDMTIEFYYEKFGDFAIEFIIRFWISSEHEKAYLKAKSDAIMNVKKAFDNNNITIPYPVTRINFPDYNPQNIQNKEKND